MNRTVSYRLRSISFEWDADTRDEARDAVIGYAESQKLLFVVHIAHHEEVIRIISARRATQEERKAYEEF